MNARLLLLIPMSLCLLLVGCTDSKSNENALRSVKLTHPIRLGSETMKTFSGVVQEANEISLGFKTAGQVENIHVKEGDYVHKGQLIAQLDQKDCRLEVAMLQVQCDQLTKEVGRMKQLYDDKSLSGNDYEKSQTQLKSMLTQLQMVNNKLEYTTLTSPVNGYVQSVNFERAEMVDAGMAMINLIDVEYMEVVCDIPVSLYMRRSQFGLCDCFSSLLSAERYPLQLISIVPKADGNQLYKVKFLLENSAMKKLTAGMNIEVNIRLSDNTLGNVNSDLFTLPLKAVFSENEKSYVWVLQPDSTVTKCEVTLNGIGTRGEAIVKGALSETDNIVRAGVNHLNESEKVREISDPEPTNVGGIL